MNFVLCSPDLQHASTPKFKFQKLSHFSTNLPSSRFPLCVLFSLRSLMGWLVLFFDLVNV